jgi:hypothetical protein
MKVKNGLVSDVHQLWGEVATKITPRPTPVTLHTIVSYDTTVSETFADLINLSRTLGNVEDVER